MFTGIDLAWSLDAALIVLGPFMLIIGFYLVFWAAKQLIVVFKLFLMDRNGGARWEQAHDEGRLPWWF